MLPVVKGTAVTARAISRYGLATVILSGLGIWALPEGGFLYGLMVIPFNFRLVQMIHRLLDAPDNLQSAKGLFRWSILYMFGICLLLVLSRLPMAVNFDIQGMALVRSFAFNNLMT